MLTQGDGLLWRSLPLAARLHRRKPFNLNCFLMKRIYSLIFCLTLLYYALEHVVAALLDGLWVWRETFRKGGGITFIVKVHSRIVHKIGLVISTFIPPSAETAIGRKASRSLFHCCSA